MKRNPMFLCAAVLTVVVFVVMSGCLREHPELPEMPDSPVLDVSSPSARPDLAPGESNWIEPSDLTLASLSTTDLNSQSASDVVDALLGAGPNAPIVSNITYTGANIACGTFTGGTGIIGFESGVILSSGNIASVPGPNVSDGITTVNGTPGDADLDNLIPGFSTNDAAVLEFDFECEVLLVISFSYVFTSDEYNEFVNTSFNDVFGFFVNGVNIALLPDLVTPVSINNLNCNNPYNPPTGANCALFINNDLSDGGGAIDTEMDGLTVVLTATAAVNPGVNHIKLAIADAGDFVLDSNVFIKGESFVCAPPEPTTFFDVKPTSCPNPFNDKSKGVMPTAILGTEDFDVTEIDQSSILLNGVIAPIRSKIQDVATPFEGELCGCTEEGPDGILDLTLKFKTQEVAAILGPGEIQLLTISGTLLDGTPFEASDCIVRRGGKEPTEFTE